MEFSRSTAIYVLVIALMLWGYASVAGRRDHKESLGSLSEATLSSEFGSSFWILQRSRGGPLWEEALRVCGGGGGEIRPRPNCVVVALVAEDTRHASAAPGREPNIAKEHEQGSAVTDIGTGLTGHGAKAGSLPTLRP